jgi:hypothetical protein
LVINSPTPETTPAKRRLCFERAKRLSAVRLTNDEVLAKPRRFVFREWLFGRM